MYTKKILFSPQHKKLALLPVANLITQLTPSAVHHSVFSESKNLPIENTKFNSQSTDESL